MLRLRTNLKNQIVDEEKKERKESTFDVLNVDLDPVKESVRRPIPIVHEMKETPFELLIPEPN